MGNIGYASQNKAVLEHFQARAAHILGEQDLLDGLAFAIQHSSHASRVQEGYYCNKSQLGIGFRMTQPMSSPNNQSPWKMDARMSGYRNREALCCNSKHVEADSGYASQRGAGSLQDVLARAATNPEILEDTSTATLLGASIGEALFDFMMKPPEEIDVNSSP